MTNPNPLQVWTPVADGNPVPWLGRNLEVFGDELTIMDSNNLATADLRDGFRLCAATDGPGQVVMTADVRVAWQHVRRSALGAVEPWGIEQSVLVMDAWIDSLKGDSDAAQTE